MTKFSKPHRSISSHINRLKRRGMTFGNEEKAEFHLKHIGYYRLTSYWLPHEIDHENHIFKPGTIFEDIVKHYEFDRALRLFIMDAVERIEISVRTKWVYEMGAEYGPHAHLTASLFSSKTTKPNKKKPSRVIWNHKKGLEDLQKEVSRSREQWVAHFKYNYEEQLPPLWAVCELMTLGSFSKWYSFTKDSGLRNRVARSYELDETILTSFLHHLAVIRNICAHHSRLWNRGFTFTFKIPRKPINVSQNINQKDIRKLYNTLIVMVHLMKIICPESDWGKRLLKLLDHYQVDLSTMGFPSNFKNFSS